MSFTDGKPRITTAETIKLPWHGYRDGKFFRCCICGYKFKVGDQWRWVFTNNIPKYSGNPLVCENCDGVDVIEKWKAHCDEWKNDIKERFWQQLFWYAASVEQESMQK